MMEVMERTSAEQRLAEEIADFAEMHLNSLTGSGISARNPVGDGLIHIFALRGDNELLELALDQGEDIDEGGECEDTTLLYAIGQRKWDTVRLLVKRGADISIRDMYRETPAWNARKIGAPEDVLKLLGAA